MTAHSLRRCMQVVILEFHGLGKVPALLNLSRVEPDSLVPVPSWKWGQHWQRGQPGLARYAQDAELAVARR